LIEVAATIPDPVAAGTLP